MELSNNPVMLDLFVGMQTKRIRVGQLGIVLPAENPIRVAENIAMLDHMTGGRANAGFARGYQRRWVDIMAQHAHGVHGALPDQHDEKDAANRQAFEENFQLIKKCWTQEMVSVKGKYWSVPAEGTPWDIPATNMYGKGIENGIVKSVGVVPKPLQKPHPPICSSRSPRRTPASSGAPRRTSPRSCRPCTTRTITGCSSSIRSCPASRSAPAWASCATLSSARPTPRPTRCGRTRRGSRPRSGSGRSASAAD